jgi:hypothetical protein
MDGRLCHHGAGKYMVGKLPAPKLQSMLQQTTIVCKKIPSHSLQTAVQKEEDVSNLSFTKKLHAFHHEGHKLGHFC